MSDITARERDFWAYDVRCPTCRMGWGAFPPCKIDGAPDAYRCVECKAVYTGPMLDAQVAASGVALTPHAGEGPGPSTHAASGATSPSASPRGEPAPDTRIPDRAVGETDHLTERFTPQQGGGAA